MCASPWLISQTSGWKPADGLSVIIPVHRELDNGNLRHVLEQFAGQTAPMRAFDLTFVVNNRKLPFQSPTYRENQRTLEVLKTIVGGKPIGSSMSWMNDVIASGLQCTVLDRASQKRGTSRNMGQIRDLGISPVLRRCFASGEDRILAMMDADVRVGPEYAAQILGAFQASGMPATFLRYDLHLNEGDALTQPELAATHQKTRQLFMMHQLVAALLPTPQWIEMETPQIVLRASALWALGGMPAAGYNEDYILSKRIVAAYGAHFLPDVTVSAADRARPEGFNSAWRLGSIKNGGVAGRDLLFDHDPRLTLFGHALLTLGHLSPTYVDETAIQRALYFAGFPLERPQFIQMILKNFREIVLQISQQRKIDFSPATLAARTLGFDQGFQSVENVLLHACTLIGIHEGKQSPSIFAQIFSDSPNGTDFSSQTAVEKRIATQGEKETAEALARAIVFFQRVREDPKSQFHGIRILLSVFADARTMVYGLTHHTLPDTLPADIYSSMRVPVLAMGGKWMPAPTPSRPSQRLCLNLLSSRGRADSVGQKTKTPRNPNELGFVTMGLLSFFSTSVTQPVRAIAKNGAGFFLGEIGSEALLGHWDYFKHLSPAKVARSYVSLTLGGEAGRLAAAGLSVFRAVRALPVVQGVMNRFLPLFGAIVMNNVAETGHVEWSSLPKTALTVGAASQIVHGGIGLLSRSRFLTTIGKTIGLVSKLGKATFIGAALSTVAEFTVIKGMGIVEKHLNEKEAWCAATDRLLSIVRDDQVQWASHDHRPDTDAALGALADQIRVHWEGARQARAAEFAQELAQLGVWRKDAMATSAHERTQSVAEIDAYVDRRRREIESEQVDALKQFDPRPQVTFTRLSTDGHARVPEVLAEVQHGLERDTLGLPMRVGLPDELGAASVDNTPGYHNTLAASYHAQIAKIQDWDALLEQIAQYRRDRSPRPPKHPVPESPKPTRRVARR